MYPSFPYYQKIEILLVEKKNPKAKMLSKEKIRTKKKMIK